jgi:poly-gamma-glutamate capsule biosynthesis protein CapA/YwtB (metallophosphatase superfamily)
MPRTGRPCLVLLLLFGLLILSLTSLREDRPALRDAPREEGRDSLLIVAAGDIMVHDRQLESAYRRAADSYDFSGWFAPVKPYLQEGDLVVGNLETTLAGKDLYFSGYPAFNSPESLAVALREAGFHLVATANNHCLDRGEKGVLRTMAHLEEAGLDFFGTARSREERERVLVIQKKGFRVAFLAYTYGTNGIPVPAGKEYLVNLLEEERILADLKKARGQADLVVVSLHWGLEYRREPGREQQQLAERLIAGGADLILGCHPHVLQPVEFIRTPAGREGVVAYSLGNLISDQVYPYTDTGLLLRVEYHKDAKGIRLGQVTAVPTWVHRYYPEGRFSYRVLPVADALHRYDSREEPYLGYSQYRHLQGVWQATRQLIWLPPYSVLGEIFPD